VLLLFAEIILPRIPRADPVSITLALDRGKPPQLFSPLLRHDTERAERANTELKSIAAKLDSLGVWYGTLYGKPKPAQKCSTLRFVPFGSAPLRWDVIARGSKTRRCTYPSGGGVRIVHVRK
jgi:hypothetical protein